MVTLGILLGSFLMLLVMGVPIAVGMGIASIAAVVFSTDIPAVIVGQRMLAILDSFPFLALPFFIAAGLFMERGGITQRLVDFASIFVGRITGGLAQVVIGTNLIMAGTSGSATADCVATGTVLIPAMSKAGYSRAFASALTAAASTVGPIVPPSIMFVIYGSITNVSVQRLFMGGIVPGLLMTLYMMIAAYLISRRRKYPKLAAVSLRDAVLITIRAAPALLMPVIVVGGILGGVFTPTEAGAVAALCGFILSLFVYRGLKWSEVGEILVETGSITAAIMLIVSAAFGFGWIIARERVPELLVHLFTHWTSDPWIFLACINLLLFILSSFLEAIPCLILMAPVLLPLLGAYGVDPVHFGVVMVLNLMVGLLMPPVGLLMFIVCTIGNVSLKDYTREILPFVFVIILTLILVTYVSQSVLFLPHMLLD